MQYRILLRAGDVSYHKHVLYDQDITSEVFLDNLKNATHWGVKSVGVELLRDQVEHGMMEHILHICTHFSNLIKVSERVVVRQNAGAALVRTLELLRRDQRNEVVVELGKGLEMGQYEISKYIPEYLARPLCTSTPASWTSRCCGSRGCWAPPTTPPYPAPEHHRRPFAALPRLPGRFPEPERAYEARRQELLGLLLQGLAHYREEVRQEALLVTGPCSSTARCSPWRRSPACSPCATASSSSSSRRAPVRTR